MERVERYSGRCAAVRYHDYSAGRVYVVFGGCVFSVSTFGRETRVTAFGYRLRSPSMCALVCSGLAQNSFYRDGGHELPPIDFLFSHHLGLASGDSPEDLMNAFGVNVRGLILSKMFVGFTVPDGVELKFGEIDNETGNLRLLVNPKAINMVTGFEYQMETLSLELTQAELSSIPPFLATDLKDLLSATELRRTPLRQSYPQIPVIIKGEKSLKTVTVPKSGNRGDVEGKNKRKTTSLADHVQVKTIPEIDAASCDEEQATELSKTSTNTTHWRVWKVVSLIEGALSVRNNSFAAWLGFGNKNPTDKLRTVLKEEAMAVCNCLGPWTEVMAESVIGPSPEMIYAVVNYLLELGGYQNKFGLMEDLCNKYSVARGLDINEDSIDDPEMAIVEDLAVSIMRKIALVREVLRLTVENETDNPKDVRDMKTPKKFFIEGMALTQEAGFLLNATRLNVFGNLSWGRDTKTPVRQFSKKALARTDKRVAAAMACVYLESRPSQCLAEIFGDAELTAVFETARLNIIDPWDSDDICGPLLVLESLISFRLE